LPHFCSKGLSPEGSQQANPWPGSILRDQRLH
jgi:hypothetical protein